MSRRRFMLLLAAALVAVALAFFFSSRRHLARDTQGTLLFPTLADAVNGVSAVTITKGAATPTVTVHRSGDRWTVAERADYPADVAKLRKLLLALSEARILEEKTSIAANYPAIGVADPGPAEGAGTRIAVTAPHETDTLVVGKPIAGGSFVRPGGRPTTYVVEPALSFETEPRYWIDSTLVDVPTTAVAGVAVKIGGDEYRLRRAPVASPPASAATTATPTAAAPAAAPATGFVFETATPKGRTALDAASLTPPSTALANLTADDVAAASSIDFGSPSTAVFTLNDGDTLSLAGVAVGDKRWITVTRSKDPALGAKTAGHAYEIPRYRYDEIFRPLEQLLAPKPDAKPVTPAKPGPTPHATRTPPSSPGAGTLPAKPPA
jgi:hypothetical protein